MLILTRREQERLCIGDDITVQIIRIKGGRVSIGIECPSTTKILREEIKNKEENDRKGIKKTVIDSNPPAGER